MSKTIITLSSSATSAVQLNLTASADAIRSTLSSVVSTDLSSYSRPQLRIITKALRASILPNDIELHASAMDDEPVTITDEEQHIEDFIAVETKRIVKEAIAYKGTTTASIDTDKLSHNDMAKAKAKLQALHAFTTSATTNNVSAILRGIYGSIYNQSADNNYMTTTHLTGDVVKRTHIAMSGISDSTKYDIHRAKCMLVQTIIQSLKKEQILISRAFVGIDIKNSIILHCEDTTSKVKPVMSGFIEGKYVHPQRNLPSKIGVRTKLDSRMKKGLKELSYHSLRVRDSLSLADVKNIIDIQSNFDILSMYQDKAVSEERKSSRKSEIEIRYNKIFDILKPLVISRTAFQSYRKFDFRGRANPLLTFIHTTMGKCLIEPCVDYEVELEDLEEAKYQAVQYINGKETIYSDLHKYTTEELSSHLVKKFDNLATPIAKTISDYAIESHAIVKDYSTLKDTLSTAELSRKLLKDVHEAIDLDNVNSLLNLEIGDYTSICLGGDFTNIGLMTYASMFREEKALRMANLLDTDKSYDSHMEIYNSVMEVLGDDAEAKKSFIIKLTASKTISEQDIASLVDGTHSNTRKLVRDGVKSVISQGLFHGQSSKVSAMSAGISTEAMRLAKEKVFGKSISLIEDIVSYGKEVVNDGNYSINIVTPDGMKFKSESYFEKTVFSAPYLTGITDKNTATNSVSHMIGDMPKVVAADGRAEFELNSALTYIHNTVCTALSDVAPMALLTKHMRPEFAPFLLSIEDSDVSKLLDGLIAAEDNGESYTGLLPIGLFDTNALDIGVVIEYVEEFLKHKTSVNRVKDNGTLANISHSWDGYSLRETMKMIKSEGQNAFETFDYFYTRPSLLRKVANKYVELVTSYTSEHGNYYANVLKANGVNANKLVPETYAEVNSNSCNHFTI